MYSLLSHLGAIPAAQGPTAPARNATGARGEPEVQYQNNPLCTEPWTGTTAYKPRRRIGHPPQGPLSGRGASGLLAVQR
jgi:hypothetical protein